MSETTTTPTPTADTKVPAVVSNAPAPLVTEKEVTLVDGTKKIIKKLKAGKYYEAQKHYVTYLQCAQELLSGANFKVSNVTTKDGEVDKDLVAKELLNKENDSFKAILQQSGALSDARQNLVAIALGETVEFVQENYYPEDFEVVFLAALELNDFAGNLKKSVAL